MSENQIQEKTSELEMQKHVIADKTILLHVLELLYKSTSKENALCNVEIAEKLNEQGVLCDRKTVGRNILLLKAFGFPIFKKGRNHYFDRKKDAFFTKTPTLPTNSLSENEKEKIKKNKKLYLLIHFCFIYMHIKSADGDKNLIKQVGFFMDKDYNYILSDRTVNRNEKYMIEIYKLPIEKHRKRKNDPDNSLIYHHKYDFHFPYHDENGNILWENVEKMPEDGAFPKRLNNY